MIIIQLIAVLFSLIMIYFAYLHYSRNELRSFEFILWVLIWTITIIIIAIPDIIRNFARSFEITRLFDLMITGGFIVIVPLIYISFIRTRRFEKKLEEIIRNHSLKSVKKVNHEK